MLSVQKEGNLLEHSAQIYLILKIWCLYFFSVAKLLPYHAWESMQKLESMVDEIYTEVLPSSTTKSRRDGLWEPGMQL